MGVRVDVLEGVGVVVGVKLGVLVLVEVGVAVKDGVIVGVSVGGKTVRSKKLLACSTLPANGAEYWIWLLVITTPPFVVAPVEL